MAIEYFVSGTGSISVKFTKASEDHRIRGLVEELKLAYSADQNSNSYFIVSSTIRLPINESRADYPTEDAIIEHLIKIGGVKGKIATGAAIVDDILKFDNDDNDESFEHNSSIDP